MPGIGKILLMGQCKPAACFYYSLRPKNVLFPTPHFKGLKKRKKLKYAKETEYVQISILRPFTENADQP